MPTHSLAIPRKIDLCSSRDANPGEGSNRISNKNVPGEHSQATLGTYGNRRLAGFLGP